MTGRLEEIVNQMPIKERHVIERSQPQILQLEGDINDEILGVAYVFMFEGEYGSRSRSISSGVLVATSTRLIVLIGKENGGGTMVLPYADIQQARLVGGNKKLFGSYADPYIVMVRKASQERMEWKVGSDNQWGRRTADVILAAHGRHALNS